MGCGLRKEIEDMLSLLAGGGREYRLRCDKSGPRDFSYSLFRRNGGYDWDCGVYGCGSTKAEAMRRLLEKWRDGSTDMPPAPAGSAEELKLALAVRGEAR